MDQDVRGYILWRSEIRHALLVAPALTDELVVTVGLEQSSQGRIGFLDAWDRDTGQQRWTFSGSAGMGLRGGILRTPVISEELLCFGDGRGAVRCLDIRTGVPRWEAQVEAPIVVGPIIVRDQVLFADEGGNLTAFELHSGRRRWIFRTEDAIRATPAVDNEHIILSSWDGYIYAVGTQGALVWKVNLSPIRPTSMTVVAGHIFLFDSASGELRTVEVKRKAGGWQVEELWRLGMGRRSGIQLVYGEGLLCVVDKGGDRINCLDATSGTLRWTTVTESSPLMPVVICEQLIVACRDGRISAFELKTGAEKWRVETGIPLSSDPSLHEGVLYAGGSDGAVYALVLKK